MLKIECCCSVEALGTNPLDLKVDNHYTLLMLKMTQLSKFINLSLFLKEIYFKAELNSYLKSESSDLCAKLKKEIQRKENRLQLKNETNSTNSSQIVASSSSSSGVSVAVGGNASGIHDSSSSSLSSDFLAEDLHKRSSVLEKSSTDLAVVNELKIKSSPLPPTSPLQPKQPPRSLRAIDRIKSCTNIGDLPNIEEIETQIEQHLRELESSKIRFQASTELNNQSKLTANTTTTTTTNSSSIPNETTVKHDDDHNDDEQISPSAIYRTKKLESMQSNQHNQSSYRRPSRTIYNREQLSSAHKATNETASGSTADSSRPSLTILRNKSAVSGNRPDPSEIELFIRPLLNRSNTNLSITSTNGLYASNSGYNASQYEIGASSAGSMVNESLAEIDKIQSRLNEQIDKMISNSMPPSTKLKTVSALKGVNVHEKTPASLNSEKHSVLPPPSDRLKSPAQRKIIRGNTFEHSNSLPASAKIHKLRASLNSNSNKNEGVENSFGDLMDKSVLSMASRQGGGKASWLSKTTVPKLSKNNVNFTNNDIFDLIRIDGKSYATPESKASLNLKIFNNPASNVGVFNFLKNILI
jgi:hypothetical protein